MTESHSDDRVRGKSGPQSSGSTRKGDLHVKDSPSAFGAINSHLASVRYTDRADNREAQARPAHLARTSFVRSVETIEYVR
jgi:hypothetical protein